MGYSYIAKHQHRHETPNRVAPAEPQNNGAKDKTLSPLVNWLINDVVENMQSSEPRDMKAQLAGFMRHIIALERGDKAWLLAEFRYDAIRSNPANMAIPKERAGLLSKLSREISTTSLSGDGEKLTELVERYDQLVQMLRVKHS